MNSLISAASLMMTVVAVLYGVWHPDLIKALEVELSAHAADNVIPKRIIRNALFGKAIPLTVTSMIITIIFAPNAIEICAASAQYWMSGSGGAVAHYDAVSAAYCFVVIISLLLTCYIGSISINLFRRWR